jgi:DNA replication protein DnaC
MMTDDVAQLLKALHLRAIAEVLDTELANAETQQLSYQDLVARLLRVQWHHHQQSALEWRIERAKMPEKWTLESFPFKRQTGISQKQIRAFAELEFVGKAENIVFIGPTGVGKSGLASGLLLKALENGHRGFFIKAQDLFDEMYASLADRSSRKLVDKLARFDVLVIDEMGYLNLRPEQTNIFFKLMEERYRRRATIITTNLEYDEWHHFLGNKPLVDALLSRLCHQCHTVRINGPSLRDPKDLPSKRVPPSPSSRPTPVAHAEPTEPAPQADGAK